jgi:hypothetical protein
MLIKKPIMIANSTDLTVRAFASMLKDQKKKNNEEALLEALRQECIDNNLDPDDAEHYLREEGNYQVAINMFIGVCVTPFILLGLYQLFH